MMNLLDILLVVVVAVFTLRGLLRGLVKEVFTLAAVVAGFILSNLYHELPAPLLERFISGPSNVKAAGYILVFTLTLVATFILYKLIALCVKISLAKWLDYSTGALFGLIEGTVISAFLVLLLTNFLPERTSWPSPSWSRISQRPRPTPWTTPRSPSRTCSGRPAWTFRCRPNRKRFGERPEPRIVFP